MGENIYDTSHIKNYLLYLKKECGLSVSLHMGGYEPAAMLDELRMFNIHDNSYCVYVKSSPEAQKHCIRCQAAVRERCSGGAFEGVCYAGVREFVYPINDGSNNIVGFVSVSGYKDANGARCQTAVSQKYALPLTRLRSTYASLKEKIPSRRYIDTLIVPLCDMLELTFIRGSSHAPSEQCFGDRILHYLGQNYTHNITSRDICSHFHCSRTHMSRTFNQHTGMTVREYLTGIRIENAKQLLRHSELNITEIAYSVGFGDSAYFSGLFKKNVGIAPLAYRRKSSGTYKGSRR